jgi:2-hydroxychromene-2-carboxylate isomerase
MDSVRFYFSFRSPYAWLAFHRIDRIVDECPVRFEYIPVAPSAAFQVGTSVNSAKRAYIREDIARFADACGLTLRWPDPFDTEWVRPHAAYLFAEGQGKGRMFALATYAARFSEGRNIGTDQVLERLSHACGLAPEAVVEAAHDPRNHEQVLTRMRTGRDDGLFGVPFFVFRGHKYWGNDRIEWLLREVYRSAGRNVLDLRHNPLNCPYDGYAVAAP